MPALVRLEPSVRFTFLSNAQGRELLVAQPWSDTVEHATPRASRRGLRALLIEQPLRKGGTVLADDACDRARLELTCEWHRDQ